MEKRIRKLGKRALSAILICCMIWEMIPVTFVQAAEIKGGDFNPIDKNITIDFRFDLTQRVTIEVLIDGVAQETCLMTDHEIPGSLGQLGPRLPEESEYYENPRSINDTILPNVRLSEVEGEDDDGNPQTYTRLEWDGRLDGKPVIGEDPSKDECVVEIRIYPQGYPEKNKPCEEVDDGAGGTTHVHGENWTWSTDQDWVFGVAIYIDYKAIFEGADPDTAFLMVKGGTSYKITCEMDEVFRGNSALVPAFAAYMNTNAIAPVDVNDPVNMVDGNFTFSYPDLKLHGEIPLTFLRTYNSRDKDGSLGRGFTHGYEYSLLDDDGIIRVTMPYGEEVRFLRRANGTYHSLQNQGFVLEDAAGGYVMTHEYGAKFFFSSEEKLKEIRNPAGVTVAELSYTGDRLTRIDGVAGSLDLTWENGHIVNVEDTAGRSVSYTYEGDLLTSVTNPDGDTLCYGYDENGFLSSAGDFEGNEYVRNTYDEQGRVTDQIFINADIETEATFSYDDENRVNTYVSASGYEKKYYYDEYRNIIAVEDDNGIYANTYDSHRADSATDQAGGYTSYEFDSANRVSRINYPDGTSAQLSYVRDSLIGSVTYEDGSSENYAYDANGNVTAYTDQNGNVTHFAYNAKGLVTQETNALGDTILYDYDEKGRLLSVTDAEGGEVSYAYDSAGRITAAGVKVSNSETAVTQYEYSDAGKLLKTTDALGNETSYTYNGNGFLTSVTDALGGITTTEYGTNGQPLKVTDANGGEILYAYDGTTALLTGVTDAEGNETLYAYNDRGLLCDITDAEGGVTSYEYDELDRLVKVTDALGGETAYEYDSMGRTVSLTDANGDRTEYVYDALGRLVKSTDPEGGEIRYSYDFAGNLLKTTDANGHAARTEYNEANYVVKTIDAENFETAYAYDGAGRVVQVTDALGGVTAYTYDLAGDLLTETDANGNVTRYVYDLLGRITQRTNADHSTVTYAYDALGRLTEYTDERGGKTSYTYDAKGNLLSVKDALGSETLYVYNLNDQVISVTCADGGTVSYDYSPLGSISEITDQLGGVTQILSDPLGRQQRITDAEGHVTEYFYDPVGNLLKTEVDGTMTSERTYSKTGQIISETDGLGNAAQYTYDAAGNLTTYTDREGNATAYTYDCNNQLTKTRNALGAEHEYTYDALGRLIGETDENGNTYVAAYDPCGSLLSVTDALGNVNAFAYDAMGRVVSQTDALGNVTAFAYDASGNLIRTTDAEGQTAQNTYDANSNLIREANRLGEWVQYEYDSMGRLAKRTDQLNHAQNYAYDLAGNLISETDANRNTSLYAYDALGRLVSETNPEGGSLAYTYDHLGNLESLTADGANGQRGTTSYEYDAAGNLIRVVSPLGFTTLYTYDKEGNVLTKTDGNGKVTNYEYDALYRQVKRTDEDGEALYAYDALGNLLSAQNSAGTVVFAYDALSRVVEVTNEDSSKTSYTYDASGRRLSITYPDGKGVETAYDATGNVVSLADYDGSTTLYTRDAEGRVIKESHPDGSSTEYDYNAAGLLTLQKEVTKDHATLRQIAYIYDDAGNLTSENRSGVGIGKADELVRYYYDKAGQLVKTVTEGAAVNYSYDLAGNLLSDGEYTYTYDLQNRLLSKNGADGTATYEYDSAGNLVKEITSDGTTEYTYNAQNRLILGQKDNGESSAYTYNALGARIENVQVRENENRGYANALLNNGSRFIKDYMPAFMDGRAIWQRSWKTEVGTVVQNDFETVTRHYIPDYLSVANRDLLVTEDGSFVVRYVYDESGKRISAEFDYADGTASGAQNANGEYGENPASDIAVNDIGKVWYRTSLLNSALYAVDAEGETVAHMIYDPWGNPLIETYADTNLSGLENLNNFTGYTWDETLGFYFAQNRFYDPETHRFTQEDVVKDGSNWYVYCGNSPTNYIDPTGNFALEAAAAVTLADAAVAAALVATVALLASPAGQEALRELGARLGTSFTTIRLTAQKWSGKVEEAKSYIQLLACSIVSKVQAKVDTAVDGKPDLSWNKHTVYVHYGTGTTNQGKVYYVGRTNNFKRRYGEHSRVVFGRHTSSHPIGKDIGRDMMPVVTGLSFMQSKIVEQVLISTFSLEALENARNEFSLRNWRKALKEVGRSMEILGSNVGLDGLL